MRNKQIALGFGNYLMNNEKELAVIVDIDGTLAIMGDRGPFEYHKVEVDHPNNAVITVVKGLRRLGVNLVYVTGREKRCLPQTMRWLFQHGLPRATIDHYEIYMRPNGDRRKNEVVKEEILKNDILPFYNVILALDDDERLWSVYKRYNIPMLRVMN